MKKIIAALIACVALGASSASASTRPAPIPLPPTPIHFDPACVLAGNPVVACIIH